jgi:hypothetical protein
MLLRVPIDQGGDEYIEVEVDARDVGESVRLTSGNRPDAAIAPFSLASSVDRIMPAISAILTRLRCADQAPDEIGMEVGLKIGGETGLILAKGTAEATFTVTLSWRKPDRGPAGSTIGT